MISDERREVAARLRADHRQDHESQVTFIARMVTGKDRVTVVDVLRLPKTLADLIDRPTCRNVYDETKTGACENGFECSECGGVVEDGEGWLVNGTFNYCPSCGAKVVRGDE